MAKLAMLAARGVMNMRRVRRVGVRRRGVVRDTARSASAVDGRQPWRRQALRGQAWRGWAGVARGAVGPEVDAAAHGLASSRS
eukprot:scaffold31077_cov49-Phaeocystis_antarctica.AAC.4